MNLRRILSIMPFLLVAMTVTSYSTSVLSSDMTVRVVLYDDTEASPLHPKAEIWARGLGSWWLARDNMQDIDGRTQGKVDQLVIYPDGREGKEITVQFQLTSGMCSNACPRDMITVAIDDTDVTVGGFPIEGPYGETEVVFPRK
jgi:hypothetical protein